MSITKTGILSTPVKNYKYLINNFTETGITTNWNLEGSIIDGTVVLTGNNPGLYSDTFIVGPNDIVVFSGVLSVPTPSTTTGSPGIYLGATYGQGFYVQTYNLATGKWSLSTTKNTNAYFINSYNDTAQLTFKTYLFGYNVDSSLFPPIEISGANCSINALQLTGTDTTTKIRTGYNSNTPMVIHFRNPEIYKLNECGFNEGLSNASIGKNFIQANNFYEL